MSIYTITTNDELLRQIAVGPAYGFTPNGDISFEAEDIAHYRQMLEWNRYCDTIARLRESEPPLPVVAEDPEWALMTQLGKEYEIAAFLNRMKYYKDHHGANGLEEGPKYYDWEDGTKYERSDEGQEYYYSEY
jgi:hypothetical protein